MKKLSNLLLPLTALLVGGLVAAAWMLRRENQQLLDALARQPGPVPSARRTLGSQPSEPAPLDASASLRSTSPTAVRAEVLSLRQKIADAEKQALANRAKLLADQARDAQMLATNQDPTKGLVRLENLHYRGQATPAAALESLVWAAFTADHANLASLMAFSTSERESAQAFIAKLPPAAQAAWTPEKLAEMYITGFVADMPALEFVSETQVDEQHAMIELRVSNHPRPTKVPLQLGPNGWQMLVPDRMTQALEMQMRFQ